MDNVHGLVKTQFHLPSLCCFIAILVCLEHSFWIVQQGSNTVDGFTNAWENYLKTRHAVVDRELDDYLRSKGSDDWFTMKHCPSVKELAECRKIVFNNLLPRPITESIGVAM